MLDPVPESISAMPFWKYRVSYHASPRRRTFGFVILPASSNGGAKKFIRHLILDSFSQ